MCGRWHRALHGDEVTHPTPVRAKSIGGGIAVAVGLPFSGRPIPPEFALTFAAQSYPTNSIRKTYAIKGQEVGEARNMITQLALDDGAKYLWFLDEDLSIPQNACTQLVSTLENADSSTMACGGIYTTKSHPAEPLVYREKGGGPFWQWKMGDVFECAGLATGCMMIKTEVFRTLDKPWFKTTQEQTEDMYFCDRLVEAGFKVLADSKVMCVHWKYDGEGREFIPYYLDSQTYPDRKSVV